jgi:transcriptional regulator with XRE-family HTH domain
MSTHQLGDEQIKVIRDLEQLRNDQGLSQQKFAARLGYTGSTWNKIIKVLKDEPGHYFERETDYEELHVKLERELRRLVRAVEQEKADQSLTIHPLLDYEAVIEAIKAAALRTDSERCIAFLADKGAGKTIFCHFMRREFDAIIVETRSTWETSYYTCLIDLAEALGLKFDKGTPLGTIEREVANKLKVPTKLVFDEGEFFGKGAINLLKWLLNKTPSVIIICAIPAAFDRWLKKYPHEAGQLQRRFNAVIEFGGVGKADIAHFTKAAGVEMDDDATKALIDAANQFGAYGTVARVVDQLKRKRIKKADLAEVDVEINYVFALKRVARLTVAAARKGGAK